MESESAASEEEITAEIKAALDLAKIRDGLLIVFCFIVIPGLIGAIGAWLA